MRAIAARAARVADRLALVFRLEGALGAIRIPEPRPPAIGHELWRHTCFEAFVGAVGDAAYHELNLAPSGEWAAYAFRGYRDGGPLEDERLAPGIVLRHSTDALELEASVPLARLSTTYVRSPLRIGLSAVIETTGGTLSYWSLRHPSDCPDFHHPDSFDLRIAR